MSTDSARPAAFPATETPSRWMAGDTYRVAIAGHSTGGRISLVDASVPPGGGPAPHVHADSDETYIVISGELEFLLGDQTRVVGPGDAVFVPRGVPHRFRNAGVGPARVVFMFTPATPEQFFLEVGDDPEPGEQAPLWGPEHYTDEFFHAAARYDTLPPAT